MTNSYHHPNGHVFYRKLGHPRPLISHGEGIYLYDSDGKRYLDGSGGPLVVNVGHGRKDIVEAMRAQASAAAYVHATMFTSQTVEAYAEALAPITNIQDPRFYFLSSGSEAIEASIKLARQIQMARGEQSRRLIISRTMSYHGMTLGALAVSGRTSLSGPFQDMLRDMPKVQHPYPYRREESGQALAQCLEDAILEHGAENVAAFLAEPISGAGLGAIVPPLDYWPAIRHICDRYGVLLISDDVLVGMGRCGTWWGLDHWNVQPDILVTSKGTAGGYFPLGFVATSLESVDAIQASLGDFNHGGTFSHHAVGAAAGLATLDIIQREELVANAANMGEYLGNCLLAALAPHPNVGDVRGKGLFWAIELVKNKVSKEPFPAADHMASRLQQEALERGLIVYYSQGCVDGVNGDLLMVGPPLIIDAAQVDELVGLLSETLFSLAPAGKAAG